MERNLSAKKTIFLPYLVCFSAALFFAYELMQLHMMNALSFFIMKDLDMTATNFGNLCSTYLLADVIFLLPAGIILDRFSVRKVILSGLAFCLLGTLGLAFAQNFPQASIAHFLSGIGNAFSLLSCIMLVSKWFALEKQAFIIGLIVTIGMLGGVLAQVPFSLLAQSLTWRTTLWIDFMLGSVIFGLIYLFVQDQPEGGSKTEKKLPPPFWQGIFKSFNKQNIHCGLYTSLMNMPLMVLGAVFGTLFLTEVHQLSLSSSSFVASMICMGTIIGSPLYGYLSDKMIPRKSWMYLGAFLSLSIMMTITMIPPTSTFILATLFFLLGLFSSAQILSYPIITETSPKELTGTSMGIAAVIIMGLPMLIAPLMGLLLDNGASSSLEGSTRTYDKNAFIYAFSLLSIGFILAFLSTYFIREKKDLLYGNLA